MKILMFSSNSIKTLININHFLCSDDEIIFLMSSDMRKITLWNNASNETWRRYWKVIEWNKELYMENLNSDINNSEAGIQINFYEGISLL